MSEYTSHSIYSAGYIARKEGKSRDTNPCDYRTAANSRCHWDSGWLDADVEITAKQRAHLAGKS